MLKGTWFWILGRVGVLLALVFVGCERPQLRGDAETEAGPYAQLRQEAIGRKFETLSLGSRVFRNATVLDITDDNIVVRHDDGEDWVPWSEVSDEVRKRWGYDPSAGSVAKVRSSTDEEPDRIRPEPPPAKDPEVTSPPPPEADPVAPTSLDPAERAERIAALRKRMEAQRLGILGMESDLAQHLLVLNQLRAQLQGVRMRQSGRSSGGVRVERIGGESAVVDREREARELEAQIRAKEPLVAQLTKALQGARAEYQAMQNELDRLMAK